MLTQLPAFFDHSRHKLEVRRVDLPLDVLAFYGEEPLTYNITRHCRRTALRDANGYTQPHYGVDPQNIQLFFE